jgi:hypothetical protein
VDQRASAHPAAGRGRVPPPPLAMTPWCDPPHTLHPARRQAGVRRSEQGKWRWCCLHYLAAARRPVGARWASQSPATAGSTALGWRHLPRGPSEAAPGPAPVTNMLRFFSRRKIKGGRAEQKAGVGGGRRGAAARPSKGNLACNIMLLDGSDLALEIGVSVEAKPPPPPNYAPFPWQRCLPALHTPARRPPAQSSSRHSDTAPALHRIAPSGTTWRKRMH